MKTLRRQLEEQVCKHLLFKQLVSPVFKAYPKVDLEKVDRACARTVEIFLNKIEESPDLKGLSLTSTPDDPLYSAMLQQAMDDCVLEMSASMV